MQATSGSEAMAAASRRSLLRAVSAAQRGLDLAMQAAVVLLLGLLFATLLGNTLLRYAAGGGWRWATDIATLAFPWLIACGMVLAARRGQHIAVTLLADLLPRPLARPLRLLVALLVVVTYLGLAWAAWVVIGVTGRQVTPVLRLPLAYGYWALLFASGGMILAVLLAGLRDLLGGEELREEVSG